MNITRSDFADLPPTLTVEHAAVLLGVGRRTAYRAVEDDLLPHLRLGKRIVIPTDRFLREVLGYLGERNE